MEPRWPTRSVKPRTSSRLLAIEPTSDALTIAARPLETAMIAMISSGALPNVAFKKRPIPGPVWRGRREVAGRLVVGGRGCEDRGPIRGHAGGGGSTTARIKGVEKVVERERSRASGTGAW